MTGPHISPVVIDQPSAGHWRARCLYGPCTPHHIAAGDRPHVEQAATRHATSLARAAQRTDTEGTT